MIISKYVYMYVNAVFKFSICFARVTNRKYPRCCCLCMGDIVMILRVLLFDYVIFTFCSTFSSRGKHLLRERCTVSSCQLHLRKSISRRRGWWGRRTNWRSPIVGLNTLEMNWRLYTSVVECSPMWFFHIYSISKKSVRGKPLSCTGSWKLLRSQPMSRLNLSRGVGLAKPLRQLLGRDCNWKYEYNMPNTILAIFVSNKAVSVAWQGLGK